MAWMVLWVMGLLLSNTNGGWGREGSHGFSTSVRLDRDRSLLRYCNCPFDCLSIDGQIYHNISLTIEELLTMPRNQSTNTALRDKCMKKFDHALRHLGDRRVPPPKTVSKRPFVSTVKPQPRPTTPPMTPPIHPNLQMAQVLTTLIEVLIYVAIGLTLVFIVALPFWRTKQIPRPEPVFEGRSSRFLTAESLPIHEHSSLSSSASCSSSSAWRTTVGPHQVHGSGTMVGSSSTASQVIIHLPSIFEDSRPQSASSTSSLSTYNSPEISTVEVTKFQDQTPTNLSGTCSNASTNSTFVQREDESLSRNGNMSEYYLNTIHAHDRREQSALERNERILSLFDFKDLV